MKILVTGASGFLGSELVSFLNDDLTVKVYKPSRLELDLLSKSKIISYLSEIKPDLIIHLAAKVGGIYANIKSPTQFLLDNLQIDSNLISAALEVEVSNLLYIGSSCMYPINTIEPFKEINLGFGNFEKTNESYAIAKNVGLSLIEKISSEYKYNYRCVILSNLYGREKSTNVENAHLISSALEKFIEAELKGKKSIEIYGTGEPRREFTHVNDVAKWIYKNLENVPFLPTRLNLGSGLNLSVREYYEQINLLFNNVFEFELNFSFPNGVASKLLDSSLARNKYGWNPEVELLSGLKDALQYKRLLRESKQ